MGKVQAVSNILPFLLECKNDIEVAQRIRDLARRITIDEGLIQSEYNKIKHHNKQDNFVPNAIYLTPKATNISEQAERHLLFALIKSKDVLTENLLEQLKKIKFASNERV